MADEVAEPDSGEATRSPDVEPAEIAGASEACNARRFPRPSVSDLAPVRLALIAGLAAVIALGGLCGWLGYRVEQAKQGEQFRVRLVQAAKQGAVNLTTIDYTHADADVQRILDSASGGFLDDFKARSGPFIEVVKQAQSTSVGSVTAAGLESATDKEGQVLVAVTVNTTTKGTPENQPRYWRMRLTVVQQGEDAKVAKVDFVP